MFYKFAYFSSIFTASETVLLKGLISKFGRNKSCSSILLSSKSFVYASSNLEVVTINSASYFFGDLRNSLTNDSEKFTMHLRGVTISWVTLDDKSCNSLLSAFILAIFFNSVTSLKVATLHSSLLNIKFVKVRWSMRR